jgi:hypothetical protein
MKARNHVDDIEIISTFHMNQRNHLFDSNDNIIPLEALLTVAKITGIVYMYT